jgi:hypothetical protein
MIGTVHVVGSVACDLACPQPTRPVSTQRRATTAGMAGEGRTGLRTTGSKGAKTATRGRYVQPPGAARVPSYTVLSVPGVAPPEDAIFDAYLDTHEVMDVEMDLSP